VHPRGAGHGLVDDLADAQRLQRRVAAAQGAQGGVARLRVQPQAPTGKAVGRDAAQRQVGIGDGGALAAAAITGRARLGSGAVRPHRQPAGTVDARDGAAARADLHHLHHRDAQRQPAALAEAVHPRHLKHLRGRGLAAVDVAHLGGGATHIKRQHALDAALGRHRRGKAGATGRARLHQTHRETRGGGHRGQATRRQHQEQRTPKTECLQLGLQAAQVAGHDGLHIGIGGGGGEALVLAHLGRHLAGQRHCHPRQRLAQQGGSALLMRCVDIAVQKGHRDALHRFGPAECGGLAHGGLVQRQQYRAIGRDALAHRQAQTPRHQRRGFVHRDVVLVEAAFGAHLQHVAETFGGEQRGAGTAALDQRVGGQRGAMHYQAHISRHQLRLGQQLRHTFEQRPFGRVVGGQHFGGPALGALLQHHVGEGATDVGADAGGAGRG